MICAWRSGDITRSPDISATGSPGSRRMNEKAMIETPMKVGIRTARRFTRKRSIEQSLAAGPCGQSDYAKGGVRAGTRPPAIAAADLLGDVDAVEA